MAGSRSLAKGRETEKFTHIDYLYIFENESSSSRKCVCNCRSKDYVCSSLKCRNDQQRYRPAGSVTIGRVGTDGGSPSSARTSARTKTPLQPKPSSDNNCRSITAPATDIPVSNIESALKQLKGSLDNASSSTNSEMQDALKLAAKTLERETRDKFLMTNAGHTELQGQFEGNAKPPSSSTQAY